MKEKLRMYNPAKAAGENGELKTPLLTIRGKYLVAVDEGGKEIAPLYNFGTDTTPRRARNILDKNGYRTDWAEWDDQDGTFVVLLEDVES